MAIWTIDFEEGDLTDFDSTNDAGSILDAHGDAANTGSYGLRVTGDGINSGYGQKNLSNETDVYGRAYIYIPTGLSGGNFQNWAVYQFEDGFSMMCRIMVKTNGSGIPNSWRLEGSGVTGTNDSTNFSLDTWHYLEMHWVQGSGADGGAEFWVDGDLLLSDLDSDLTGNAVDKVWVGMVTGVIDSADVIYFDDIEADNSQIGAIAGAPSGMIQHVAYMQSRKRIVGTGGSGVGIIFDRVKDKIKKWFEEKLWRYQCALTRQAS